ncbi:MAG: N-acetylneuraminate synthase family protein [Candidatus Lindowbacteria bacterium]|nr:N-acetylneuraminate synthase family protein [Candidatus Lindowbacteria bacterium]
MKIGNVDLDKEVLVIAEIGNNHEGDFNLAKVLIDLALEGGAQAVKFQTIVPDKLVSAKDTATIEKFTKWQFSYEQFSELADYTKEKGGMFLSTPFDLDSAKYLNDVMPAFKIASGDNTFFSLMEYCASTGKPIIMSSGITDMDEFAKSKDFIEECWSKAGIDGDLVLLHCVASYPTADEDANLLFIRQIAELGVTIGYSDHTFGVDAAILSVGLGARVIEKHFTISKTYSDFRDHAISADPEDFKTLCEGVKKANTFLGSGTKRVLDSEDGCVKGARRSIVASHDLDEGHELTMADFLWVRPGGGLAPGEESKIIGKKTTKKIDRGEIILSDDCA